MSTTNATTKQGKYGTLYLYRVTYHDPIDEGFPESNVWMWGYNREHIEDKWNEDRAVYGDGFEIIKISLSKKH